jgi:hypothetical protein
VNVTRRFPVILFVFLFALTPAGCQAQDDEDEESAPEVSFESSREQPEEVENKHSKKLREISDQIAQVLKPIFENVYRPETEHTVAKANEVARKADAALRGRPGLSPLTQPVAQRKRFQRRSFVAAHYLLEDEPVMIRFHIKSTGSAFTLLLDDCQKSNYNLRHHQNYHLHKRNERFPEPNWSKLADTAIKLDSPPKCTISASN